MIDLAEVLAFVNKERAKRDLPALAELPKGIRSKACECPIARSFKSPGIVPSTLSGGTNLYTEDDPNTSVDYILHSDVVARFVNAFDDGKFPELIEA